MGNQATKKLFFYFKIYDLVYVLLAFNAVINESMVMKAATMILILFGAAAALCMAVQFRVYRKMPNIWISAAFLISYAVSSVLTLKYGVTDNIKEMLWLGIAMIVVYGSSWLYTADEIKQEFQVFSKIWVWYCTAANLISLSMVVWGRGLHVKYGLTDKVLGYKWGRLWGIYDDPNHGATIAVAAILLACYLYAKEQKKQMRILWVVTVAVQFAYIVLSDSRTGAAALAVGLFCLVFVSQYQRQDDKRRKNLQASGIALLAALCIAGAVVVVDEVAGSCWPVLDKQITSILSDSQKDSEFEKNTRKEEVESDASNGRVEIWKSGLEIAQTAPVFGVSFRNMTAYAEENLPETYLVHNSQKVKYDSMHNSVMDILVSQGLVGIGILLVLVGNTLRLMIQRLKHVKKEKSLLMSCFFAVMAAMAAGSMFISIVFYLNGPQTYIFWLCFGYFMTILGKGETA